MDTGGAAPDPLQYGDGGDGGDEGLCVVAQGFVSSEQGHGHAVVASGVGVDEKLAAHLAVEGDVIVAAVHGVGQGVARTARPGVVAGEEHRVKFLPVQPAHHGKRVAGPGPVEPGAPGQAGGVNVPGGVVGVLYQHLFRPGGQGPPAGGGHLPGHLLLDGGIVHGGRPLGFRPGDHTAGALHIGT